MNYNVRIGDNFLRGDHVDGEVYQHTDVNEFENVAKTAINANYEDIQKLQDGTKTVLKSETLDGASLSKLATETLQNSDEKVPTSAQTKSYIDTAISNIDLSGYYTKRETDAKLTNNSVSLDDNGKIQADTKTYTDYGTSDNSIFIGKGTLENILKNKPITILTGTEDDPININTIAAGLYKITNSATIGEGDIEFNGDILSVSDWSGNIRKVLNLGKLYYYNISRTNIGSNYSYTLLNVNGDVVTFYDIQELYDYLDDTISGVEGDIERLEETIPSRTSDLLNDSGFITDSDLTNYVKNTDYATSSKAGVIKSGYYGLQVDGTNGKAYCDTYTYANYGNVENQRFVSKGTLENVITGKGLVSNTDYASNNTGGVVKVSNYYNASLDSDGTLRSNVVSYSDYSAENNRSFISKGTLDNVLTATIGDIQTLLDALDTGSGV